MTETDSAQIIFKHFPELTKEQRLQFEQLGELYRDWNGKINIISRKDIDNLYCHHVLHSLGIAKAINFRPGTKVLDVGTGGGFPGIPLAILFPESQFLLIDSIGKKIKVAADVIEKINLKNATAIHRNAIEEKGKFDFIVSRAVMDTSELAKLVKKNMQRTQKNSMPNGLLLLKGGDLHHELLPFKHCSLTWDLHDYFKDEYFETKKVAYVTL